MLVYSGMSLAFQYGINTQQTLEDYTPGLSVSGQCCVAL